MFLSHALETIGHTLFKERGGLTHAWVFEEEYIHTALAYSTIKNNALQVFHKQDSSSCLVLFTLAICSLIDWMDWSTDLLPVCFEMCAKESTN